MQSGRVGPGSLRDVHYSKPPNNLPDTPEVRADVAAFKASARSLDHGVGMVLNQPELPKAVWEAEVDKMRNVYKAPIDDKDVDAIVHYLISIKGAN